MHRLLIGMAGLALAGGLATGALADAYALYPPPLPPPEGVGCYWHHGVRYCSRYCYWEIDGYRYCHRRPEEAVSQAPYPWLYEAYPEAPREARRGRPLK